MSLLDEHIEEATNRVLNRYQDDCIPIDYLVTLVLNEAGAMTNNPSKKERRLRRIQEYILSHCGKCNEQPYSFVEGKGGGVMLWASQKISSISA